MTVRIITLGPLTGYAVVYRFVVKERSNKPSGADLLGAPEGGVLVIHLADGCVSFETTFLFESRGGGDLGLLWIRF